MNPGIFTYRIRDWDDLYETADSRKTRRLSWVKVPNKQDGLGYRRIAAHPQGPQIFAAWVLMLQVASKCPTRGTLSDEEGPLTPDDLSLLTGFPAPVFAIAFEVLSTPRIGWLDAVQSASVSAADPAGTIHPDGPGCHPDAIPIDRDAIRIDRDVIRMDPPLDKEKELEEEREGAARPAPAHAREAEPPDPGPTPSADGVSVTYVGIRPPPRRKRRPDLADSVGEALRAIDAWADALPPDGRGCPLDVYGREPGQVRDFVEQQADQPPILEGDRSIRRDLLIPRAVEATRRRLAGKGDGFRSMEWAIGCVRQTLAEWASRGPPPESAADPEATRAARSACIADRVMESIAAKQARQCKEVA